MHELTDFEQIERIKAGLRQYGIPVLLTLAFVLLISATTYFFYQKQAARLIENATDYQKVTTALQSPTATLSEVSTLAKPLFHRSRGADLMHNLRRYNWLNRPWMQHN